MIGSREPATAIGVAWICRHDGQLLDAAYFGIPDCSDQIKGRLFVDVLGTADRGKAGRLLESLQHQTPCFVWEISMTICGDTSVYQFAGCKVGDQLMVIASPTRSGINQINQLLRDTWPEAFSCLDAGWRDNLGQLNDDLQRDREAFDEISRLNNELVTLHRKLVGSEQRYRVLTEHAGDVIAKCTLQGKYLFVSPSCERILGYPPEQMLGCLVYEFIDPCDVDNVQSAFREMLNGTPQTTLAYRVRHRHGRVVWLESVVQSIPNAAHETVNEIIVVSRDVTERITLQQALLDQQRSETESIQRELAQAKDELIRSTRLATLGQITAQIAHDLRNPLGSIRNAAYVMHDELQNVGPDLREFVEIIREETETCTAIISNLLEATQPREPSPTQVDLLLLVKSAFKRLHAPDAVELKLLCRHESFYIDFDFVQCRQMVDNLLSNALEAIRDEGCIEVEITREKEADLLRVRDTGPGVRPEHQSKVFEVLFTTKSQGTGLGLSICRQIVEKHGGTIELEQCESAGASFLVGLPRNIR